MKKFILILSLITGFTITTSAQSGIRLSVTGGYVFDDNMNYYNNNTEYYEGTVEGGFQWGLEFEYVLRNNLGLGFKYLHQDTKAPFSYYNNGVKSKEFDLGVNYYLFGGTYYFELDNKMIEPYVGLGFGWANLKAKTDSTSGQNRTAFAWNLKGGTNIWFGEAQRVGVKVQGEFLSASAATGGAYFWTYYGPVYANTYTTLNQFSLGAGLVFKLGSSK